MLDKQIFNPREKVLFSLGNMALGIVLGITSKTSIAVLFFVAILHLDRRKRKIFFKFYLALSPFILASVAPAFLNRDISSFWSIASSLLSSNMVLGYLIFSSHPGEVTEMIKGLGLPNSLTEMALLIYRYISLLGKFYRDVNRSLQARMAYRGIKSSYGALTKGVVAVFLKALSQSKRTVISLEARNFRGKVFFNSVQHPLRKGFWLATVFWSSSLIFMEVFL